MTSKKMSAASIIETIVDAIGRNIMKYHRFLHHKLEKFEGKEEQKTA